MNQIKVLKLIKQNRWIFASMLTLSATVMLLFSFMMKMAENVVFPPAFMSANTVQYEIFQIKIPDRTENYYYSMFWELAEKAPSLSFYMDFYENQNGCAVSYDDFGRMALPMREGRRFTREDIAGRRNAALVSEQMLDQCRLEGGKRYFYFDGQDYEVIGIYKKEDRLPSYFINLFSKALSDNILAGDLYVDGEREEIEEFINAVQSEAENRGVRLSVEEGIVYSESMAALFARHLLKNWAFVLLASFPPFFFLFSAGVIARYCLSLRREEFDTHFAAGCSREALQRRVKREILFLFFIVWLFHVLCAFCLSGTVLETAGQTVFFTLFSGIFLHGCMRNIRRL